MSQSANSTDEMAQSVAREGGAPAGGQENAEAVDTLALESLEGKVIDVLKTVYDPEIPVDIYELGLIYKIAIQPDLSIDIDMTLTSPACPAAGSLPPEVEFKVASIPDVTDVRVNIVWEPTWTPEFMSEAAKLELNMW